MCFTCDTIYMYISFLQSVACCYGHMDENCWAKQPRQTEVMHITLTQAYSLVDLLSLCVAHSYNFISVNQPWQTAVFPQNEWQIELYSVRLSVAKLTKQKQQYILRQHVCASACLQSAPWPCINSIPFHVGLYASHCVALRYERCYKGDNDVICYNPLRSMSPTPCCKRY